MEKTSPTPSASGQDSNQDFEEIREQMAASMSQDEADRKARIEYLRSLTAQKQPKKGRGWLKVLITVVVVAVLAGGVFWFMSKKAGDKLKDDQANTSQQQPEPDASKQPVASVKRYDSTAFNLGFDHPENWKVTEAAGKISVASPAAQFRTTSGTVQAQVVFTIQSKQATLPAFSKGNGLAARASEKVAYATPTPNQRAQTYLSFVSNAGAATVGIDSVFVTGDLGYQKDQAVPQTDIIQGDPLVSIFFARCQDNACAADPASAKVTIADSAWTEDNSLIKAVKAMLTSLTIQ